MPLRIENRNNTDDSLFMGARILVIGGDHENTLASVRALGRECIPFDLVIHGVLPGTKTMVGASKYAPHPLCIDGTYAAIQSSIVTWMGDFDPSSCILLPSSDLAALVVDEQFRPLGVKTNGFVGGRWEICKLMDKFTQAQWAAERNIPVAKGVEVDLTAVDEASPISLPVIIKPAVSAEGRKSDISICRNVCEYVHALESYVDAGYSRALVQELIDYEYEITCVGTILMDGSYVWRAYAKEAVYPVDRGSTALSRLETDPQVCTVIENLMKVMAEEGYRGPCDIEFFKTSKGVLLNEINYRQSGIAAFTFYEDLFLPALWTMSLMGIEATTSEQVVRIRQGSYYHAMSEGLYLYYVKETGGGILNWLHAVREPGGKTLLFPGDNSPFWAFVKKTIANQLRKLITKFDTREKSFNER